MSQTRPYTSKTERAEGLTLLEVMVSITILSIGLLAVALLVSSTSQSGTRARYMNMANVLASEKLDNLNKYPSTDPNVACAAVCGALTGPTTCAAGDDYCDQVTVNEATGANYETQTQVVNGASVTTTIVHTATGCVDTPANCGVAAPAGGGSTFTRRWQVTENPTITAVAGGSTTITGARRITVIVGLNGQSAASPVTFQISMVRP
jgi:type IV pilus modification protein PilV